jgi:DNA-binding IclR family transcriptional regulator
MPCVSPDGKPTTSGASVLKAIKNGATTPEEISAKTGQPLFKVRSGLRELTTAGFINGTNDKLVLSERGHDAAQQN